MTLTSFGVFPAAHIAGAMAVSSPERCDFFCGPTLSAFIGGTCSIIKRSIGSMLFFYALGFAAFSLRILAWGRKRIEDDVAWFQRGIGGCVMLFSLWLAATGHLWQPALSAALLSRAWSAELELWLPFWPFEPFLPLFTLALGVWLFFWSEGGSWTAAARCCVTVYGVV